MSLEVRERASVSPLEHRDFSLEGGSGANAGRSSIYCSFAVFYGTSITGKMEQQEELQGKVRVDCDARLISGELFMAANYDQPFEGIS